MYRIRIYDIDIDGPSKSSRREDPEEVEVVTEDCDIFITGSLSSETYALLQNFNTQQDPEVSPQENVLKEMLKNSIVNSGFYTSVDVLTTYLSDSVDYEKMIGTYLANLLRSEASNSLLPGRLFLINPTASMNSTMPL